jgi:hypothetical protein
LEEPVFALKDFNLALGCRKAFIEPGFGRLLRKKAITLKCTFKDASILNFAEETEKGELSLLFDKLASLRFEHMQVRLVIWGETVEFPSCYAGGEGIKLNASGYGTESGKFDIKLKVFFSPEIARGFHEERRAILTDEHAGWLSYYLHAESGGERPSFKLESDRIRLNFEKIQVK